MNQLDATGNAEPEEGLLIGASCVVQKGLQFVTMR